MGATATLEERDARYARLRAAMAEQGLDALVLGCKGHWWTGRGTARYLSDFHLWGHDGLILFPAEGEPYLVLNSPAVAGMIARHGWITDTGGDVYLAPAFLEKVKARGLHRGRLGTVGGRWIIPAGLRDELAAGLPAAELVDADELFDDVRMIKSPLEIQQNRELWEVSKRAMERFAEALEPGADMRALAAEATRVAYAEGARDVLVLMGDRPHEYGPPRQAAIRCDDLVRFHLEICGESGHWSELTITLAFRPMTSDERSLMSSELRAYERVREAAKPGLTLAELAGSFEHTLQADGWELADPTTHFDFHGQGMDVIERPWFAAEQPWGGTGDAVLRPGVIVSYHPRRNTVPEVSWSPGVSDNLLITEDGAEWLSGGWSHEWREATA